ncbi:FAD binding domain-containing protein [Nitrosospira sp. Nsp2]|uniref:FAD-binding protein n=1 Tax=Nitrosospira sp. Nsp2 TaxID=136548 RepID=UPI000D31D040|nr:FAD-binding protein [Nitrosospira sp. Nsp2]PTR16239.1 FAD binding domain-containing protein [Nitrosospira sp. Nsp2]
MPDGNESEPARSGGTRSSFVRRHLETGRHESYEQVIDGEYVFDIDRGGKAPFETYNSATKELQGIIQACVNDGRSLRAHGALWSLSTVAVTAGRLIDNVALRLAFEVPGKLTNPAYAGDPVKLRFVECGNSVAALNDYLFAANLSIKGCGSNNGQTLAGALSTGTHGSAFNFGAMQEMVVGLHLLTGPNRNVYLERKSYPVMSPDFPESVGAEFIRDDILFNAALVSLGSFGIVHGIMIETRDLFALNAIRFRHPYDATLKAAIAACDPTLIPLPAEALDIPRDNPYHFEIFYNPNEGTPPDKAIVLVMYETAYDPASYVPPPWNTGEPGLGASGLDVMGALVGRIPSPLNKLAVPLLNSQVNQEFAPYFKKAIIRDLFRGEKTLGKTLACGVGLPVARAVEAMEIAFDLYKRSRLVLPLILSHRFVKGTKALLGFTRFDTTAVMEMDAVNTSETREFYNTVWNELDAAGIPFTLHWGKYNTFLTPERVRNRYGGEAVDQWLAARHTLMENAVVRQIFTNEFTAELGLAN